MARKPSLGELLEPHLDTLSESARERERAQREAEARAAALAAEAARSRLDEGELMALIFERLDPENLRVCEGIDFDRLIVLTEPEIFDEPEPTPEPITLEDVPPVASEPPPDLILDASELIGRNWVDYVHPIPAAVLDRPELDELQRDLLIRASRRELACLNLRYLARAEALVHLEAFVRICRARRLRFCRVIPGKGIDSKAEPVLKRAVIEWCRSNPADALGWAPELDRHGEYGTMIVELRARDR